ncbi:MAG: hypothetical protein GXP36_04680 [Actinobacteria bacterium]|nr:hypothetical protein [Actinomycetota bacterium]
MHRNRLIALVGVIIGIIGLSLEGLTTEGKALLPTLNAANPAFPDGIPTIWGGLASWAQPVLVVLILAVIVFAVRPDRAKAMDRTSSMVVSVIGVALLAYAVIKMLDAGDSAEGLQAAFAQAASAGAIPAAFTVTTGFGFLILIVGTVLVIFGGAMGFISSDDD